METIGSHAIVWITADSIAPWFMYSLKESFLRNRITAKGSCLFLRLSVKYCNPSRSNMVNYSTCVNRIFLRNIYGISWMGRGKIRRSSRRVSRRIIFSSASGLMSFDIEPIIISLTIWKNIVIMYMHNTDIIIISSTRNKLIKIYIYI